MKFSAATFSVLILGTSYVDAFVSRPTSVRESQMQLEAARRDRQHDQLTAALASALLGWSLLSPMAVADVTLQDFVTSTPSIEIAKLETMDFSMPSYDSFSDSAVSSKPKADAPAFNPFGDFQPGYVDQAKQAEEKAAAEAEKAAAEAKKADDRAAKAAAEAAEKEAAAAAKKAEKEARLKAEKEKQEAAVSARLKAAEEAASTTPDATTPSPQFDIPEIKVPDIDLKAPDFSGLKFSAPKLEIDIPKVEVPKVDIPKFDVPRFDMPSGASVPDMPKMDMPKVDLPSFPKVSLPSLGGGDSSSRSSDAPLASREVRDENARQAKQAYMDADNAAKEIEQQAREAREFANSKKELAKQAKDLACADRLGGKFLCLRNPFSTGF